MIPIKVNGNNYDVGVLPDTPLLWVIRENLGMTGTKYGCGRSLCGACTVHVDGQATRSCVTPVSSVAGKEITTIEGLSPDGSHPVQLAWIAEDVPQCGYCQPGQIMAAAALLAGNPKPTDSDIDDFMSGILCRCGTYQRIRRAIHRAAEMMGRGASTKADGKSMLEDVRTSGLTVSHTAGSFALNAFVRIAADDTVIVTVNKSEMGQGVYTSLPMLVAEELECDWKKVRVEPAPVATIYNHTTFGAQATGGSTSVLSEWERMRRVGAAAREMLISAAAQTWGVDRAGCRAENGAVIHASGKMLTYGQLAEKAAGMPAPGQLTLKSPSEFRKVGMPTVRIDTPGKVTGKALFGMDANGAGALTALVARSPVFGGKVKSFNPAGAMAVPGVREVVQIDTGVAVIAEDFWSAKKARDVLEVLWDEGPLAALSTPGLRQEYGGLAETRGITVRREGNPEKALKAAARRIDAAYEVPYLAHAPMEPLNCLVDLRADGCEIWTGTQSQTADRDAAARVAGLKPEQVRIHTTLLGGGFGRRGNPHSDFVSEAVQVAKAIGKPVKTVWTREDDIRGGYYRPMWCDRLSAGLDEKGALTAWRHTIVGQSIFAGTRYEKALVKGGVDATSVEGAEDAPYEMPNVLVSLHSPKTGVPVQWWRSVGHSHTAFVVESFIDEAAFAAGKDPYEFRRGLLANHPRHRGVLDLAARRAGWGTSPAAGRARGIAVHESFGSFVAQVAEVSVGPDGKVRVHRVVCAVDCGRVVNPSTVEAQMESGIVFGLTAALYGAITFERGRVQQSNFDAYPLLKIGEMPEVEVHIVESGQDPGGIGEPGTPPIAPAVTNAVFAATGKRIRRLPIKAPPARQRQE